MWSNSKVGTSDSFSYKKKEDEGEEEKEQGEIEIPKAGKSDPVPFCLLDESDFLAEKEKEL